MVSGHLQKERAFIEELGLALETLGMPRMAGRILGALLIADPPEQSAEALADTLQASRGSISTMTRLLEQPGIIERVSRPGDRRTFYRNKPGAWVQTLRREAAAMTELRALAERGLVLVEGAPPEVRVGIEEMHDFFGFFETEFPKILDDWSSRHAVKRRPRDVGT